MTICSPCVRTTQLIGTYAQQERSMSNTVLRDASHGGNQRAATDGTVSIEQLIRTAPCSLSPSLIDTQRWRMARLSAALSQRRRPVSCTASLVTILSDCLDIEAPKKKFRPRHAVPAWNFS